MSSSVSSSSSRIDSSILIPSIVPSQCLYPIELPKEKLFRPYEQSVASTSSLPDLYLEQFPLAESSALSLIEPSNAVASSSRQPLSFHSDPPPSPDVLLQAFLYKSPTS